MARSANHLAASMNEALKGMIITGVKSQNTGKYPRVTISAKSESGDSETDFSFVYD